MIKVEGGSVPKRNLKDYKPGEDTCAEQQTATLRVLGKLLLNRWPLLLTHHGMEHFGGCQIGKR